MKIPAIQKDIVAHLAGCAGRPESSRALAARFLRIENADEETCRRLLAPFLLTVPGVTHRQETGWILAKGTPAVARAEDETRKSRARGVATGAEGPGLRDFVALASEGSGPGGSGTIAMVSLIPVLAGEACQEEIFPDGILDEETRAASAPAGVLPAAVLEDLIQTIGDLPVVCHRVAREVDPLRRLCAESGLPFVAPVISAARLGHVLLGLKANHAAIDLAQALGVETRGPDDCRGRARMVAASFLQLAGILEERGIETLPALLEYQDTPAAPLDLSRYAFTADDLRALPAAPGVYRFLDRDGRVIYVGKAKNLRLRIGSYFTPGARAAAKGRAVLDRVHRIETESTASELEANLLEAALIAEHRPSLNRQFDVHERAAPYGPRLNLIVVLKDSGDDARAKPACTAHFLRRGRYIERVGGLGPDLQESSGLWKRVRELIARAYFPGPDAARSAGTTEPFDGAGGEGVDIDWQLVGTFVRKYRDVVNVLDVDECAAPGDAEDRLRVLARAAAGGAGRIVAR